MRKPVYNVCLIGLHGEQHEKYDHEMQEDCKLTYMYNISTKLTSIIIM